MGVPCAWRLPEATRGLDHARPLSRMKIAIVCTRGVPRTRLSGARVGTEGQQGTATWALAWGDRSGAPPTHPCVHTIAIFMRDRPEKWMRQGRPGAYGALHPLAGALPCIRGRVRARCGRLGCDGPGRRASLGLARPAVREAGKPSGRRATVGWRPSGASVAFPSTDGSGFGILIVHACPGGGMADASVSKTDIERCVSSNLTPGTIPSLIPRALFAGTLSRF